MLTRLQHDYEGRGVQVVGIALDDRDKAREFASELAINYPILVGSTAAVLAGRRYGNRSGMLPYTVLVGAAGIIRWTYLGALDKEEVEAKIKALTGGSPVSARFMRQDFFEYTPDFKLMIAGNHKPSLRDVDPAIRDRIQIVPFKVYFGGDNRDNDIEEKLQEEWPGILQWGIDGCLEWQRIGLDLPKTVKDETAAYFAGQDTFGAWLEECCITDDAEAWETPKNLYTAWCVFAKANNDKPGRQSNFNDRMDARGYKQDKNRDRGRYWKGIKLKPATKENPWV